MSGRVLRGLHARLTGTMVGIAAGVLAVATWIVLLETHYHFAMYESQIEAGTAADLSHLNLHLEAALVQSILWTALGALLIAVAVSLALKFTPSGGTVRATLDEYLDRYELTIVDTGIGIGAEDLPYVFERFYRAEKSRARTQGGGGIGLTITKRLVEAHGGTIALESQVGQGTSVQVHVPKHSV